MTPDNSFFLPQSAVYIKALEILTLSKQISQYLVEDMAKLDNGKEHPSIYFTGDIVQHSVSLFPEISKAETKVFSEDKFKHAASVKRLTYLLNRNCERLERSVPSGRDFIKLLRKEIKGFRKLQQHWLLTL